MQIFVQFFFPTKLIDRDKNIRRTKLKLCRNKSSRHSIVFIMKLRMIITRLSHRKVGKLAVNEKMEAIEWSYLAIYSPLEYRCKI
jgi:hypothetical protein